MRLVLMFSVKKKKEREKTKYKLIPKFTQFPSSRTKF